MANNGNTSKTSVSFVSSSLTTGISLLLLSLSLSDKSTAGVVVNLDLDVDVDCATGPFALRAPCAIPPRVVCGGTGGWTHGWT